MHLLGEARPATAEDVAIRAGVSRSAVSRAFTPGASVAPETRATIHRVAAMLGYAPSLLARGLNTGRSGIVGWVGSASGVPFYDRAVPALSAALARRGLRLMLVSVPEGEDAGAAVPAILQYGADALVIASALLTSGVAAACLARGTPVVQFGRLSEQAAAHAVVADNRGGAAAVARRFARAGHRRVGVVSGPQATSSGWDRTTAFVHEAQALGLEMVAQIWSEYAYDAGRAAAPVVMPGRPTAMFCAGDLIALGFMDGLRADLGLRVPEDVAVVGFDDIEAAGWASYSLTTVRADAVEMAACAAAALEALIRAPGGEARTEVVPVSLVVRGSG